MTAGEVTLRCMFSSQSEVQELPLTTPASETSDLVYSRGTLSLSPTTHYKPGSVVIGRISGLRILTFETFEPDTIIEAEVDVDQDYDLQHHSLPPSTTTTGRHHIHLRDGDTIAYKRYELKVAIRVQQTPLDRSLGTESQSQTPPGTASMATNSHQDRTLSVDRSYETITTQPLSQPATQGSETDDDLDTPAPAPASLAPMTYAANTAAQTEATVSETRLEPESPSSNDGPPLQQKQQVLDNSAVRPSKKDDATAEEKDQMLFDMVTPSSNSKTYGIASRHVSHTPIMEAQYVRDGSEDSSKRGMKRKIAARPDTDDVDDDEPVKKRKGRLPKVARSDDDKAAFDSDNETAAVPPESPKKAPASDGPRVLAVEARPTRALFSGYAPPGPLLTFLKRSGVTTAVNEIPTRKTKFICVVPSTPLKTTTKILRSLIANKPVVTEEWLSASKEAGALLEVDAYIHNEAKAAITTDRRALFAGKIIFVTRAAKTSYGNGWSDIVEILRETGATSVESGSATTGNEITPKGRVVFVGLDDADKDVVALIRDHGRIVYRKTTLTKSVLEASFTPVECRMALNV